MSHSGTRITAPVQILGDLQPVLGTSLRGLGAIITQANINPFAYCKPFRSSVAAFANATARNNARGRGSGTGDGLTIPTGVSATWEYQRPRGIGSNEWFRELDFDGYEHAATAPIVVSWLDAKINYTGVGGKYTFTVSISARNSDGVMTSVADLFTAYELSQLYFILAVTTGKGTYYARLHGGSSSSATPMSTVLTYGGGGVTIDTHDMYNILSGESSATVSVIAAGLGQDGVQSLTTRAYSMCCTSGSATRANVPVVKIDSVWYEGLTGSLTFVKSGWTTSGTMRYATITSYTAELWRTSGSLSSVYYRFKLTTSGHIGSSTGANSKWLTAQSTPASVSTSHTRVYSSDITSAANAIYVPSMGGGMVQLTLCGFRTQNDMNDPDHAENPICTIAIHTISWQS